MKLVFLILVVQSVSHAAAVKGRYECGLALGLPVTLTVQPSKAGSFYAYSGTYQAPSTDPTTGTLIRSKKMAFAGSTETTKGRRAFHLHESARPTHQIFAEIGKKSGAAVEILELDLSKPSSEPTTRKCTFFTKP